jgi:hypothetical protein
MNATVPHTRANRRILWLLAAVFFAPLCLSFVMYYGSSWRPAGHTNHGLLIEPPRTLPAAIATRPADARCISCARLIWVWAI